MKIDYLVKILQRPETKILILNHEFQIQISSLIRIHLTPKSIDADSLCEEKFHEENDEEKNLNLNPEMDNTSLNDNQNSFPSSISKRNSFQNAKLHLLQTERSKEDFQKSPYSFKPKSKISLCKSKNYHKAKCVKEISFLSKCFSKEISKIEYSMLNHK